MSHDFTAYRQRANDDFEAAPVRDTLPAEPFHPGLVAAEGFAPAAPVGLTAVQIRALAYIYTNAKTPSYVVAMTVGFASGV